MSIQSVYRPTLSLRYVCAVFLVLLLAVLPYAALAKEQVALATTEIALSELPQEGRSVYWQIHAGIPFTHEKDGLVFGNRERLLPLKKRGYYREYTVKTPWLRSRGARRLVCGGVQAAQPDACYYTADHYASFRKIVP